MKSFFKFLLVTTLALFVQSGPLLAQKGGHHGYKNGYNKKVVVKNGPNYYNNNKTVVVVKNSHHYGYGYRHHYYRRVYHPLWGPPVGYYHRWVYFPRYNFYWDNYNSSYVYWGGGAWVRTPNPPPTIINININNEKKYELQDTNDSIDDIYDNNDSHKKDYPEN